MISNTDSSTHPNTNAKQKNDSSAGQQTKIRKMSIKGSTSKSANHTTALSAESHLLHKPIGPNVADPVAIRATPVSGSAGLSSLQETLPRYQC